MSVTKDSSTHSVQAEIREGLLDPKRKAGFYLSEDGEWIPDGWRLSRLDEVGKITTGKTPAKANPHHWGAEVAFITPTDYNGWRSLKSPARRLSAEGRSAFKNQIVSAESIAVSCIGSDMGKVVFLKEESLTNQQINCLSANSENDDLFWYYAITSDYPRLRSVAEGGGSTMPLLNKGDFSRLEFFHPALPEQKAIAAVLGSLDDKIELLREQNETLEVLAQTFFKRWFIDFNFPDENGNPYKDSGGKMILSELGEIPEGWGVCDVKSILTRSRSPKTYRKEELKQKGAVPVYEQGQSILMGFHNHTPCFDASPTAPKFIFGDHTCITKLIFTPFSLSPNVIPLQGNKFDTVWTYFAIHKLQSFIEYRRHWMELADKKVTTPANGLDVDYSTIVRPLIEKLSANELQIQSLTNLRNTILPRLMKGEIRIPVDV